MSLRTVFALVLAPILASLALSPASAGKLSDLPWDEQVDQDVRGAVRRAVTEEARELNKEENDEGKKFVHVRTNKYVELTGEGDKAATFVTIQRCLEDKMVTEQWRYVLQPETSGPDYEIVDRIKLYEFDDELPQLHQPVDESQASDAFSFEHDKLKLDVQAGAFLLSLRGPHANQIHLAATGRLTIDPVSDYEKMFFERELKRPRIDSEIEAVQISFHENNDAFTRLVGLAPGSTKTTPAEANALLREMHDRVTNGDPERKYNPNEYGRIQLDEFEKAFQLRIKTRDFGWIGYLYNPTGAPPTSLREILVYRERKGFSFQEGADSFDLVSHYYAPETRELPLRDRENRRPFAFVSPFRFEGMVHVDEDGVIGTVEVDLQVLRDTKRLTTFLMGESQFRFIKENGYRDLPFVPAGSQGVEIIFPEERKAGSTIRLKFGYESKWAQFGNVRMGKVSESAWLFPRSLSFLPFQQIISGPSYMHLVVRTDEDLQHVTVGRKVSEEISDGYRYTEWATEHTVNFPNLIIGKYYDPVVTEIEGIKVTGYMTKSIFGFDVAPKRNDMIKQVDMAEKSLKLFHDLFEVPYPFKELKLVSAPFDGLSAQSPSSTVYVGEVVFYTPAILADAGIDPNFVEKFTPHEVAHQWWGGHVANRNSGHYWFVESLADLSAAFFEAATRGDNNYPEHIAHWRKSTRTSSAWSPSRCSPCATPRAHTSCRCSACTSASRSSSST